tara:strand:+ start:10293 stop:10667 length:375 start_codon:yes stop_codon:yes gene_type:complete
MQTEEKLIAPYVMDLSANQYHITTALGDWFQSYQTTIAFKGEFGVLIDKDWYEGDRTRTTSKYLGQWLSRVSGPGLRQPGEFSRGAKDIHAKVKSGEYKLVPLDNVRGEMAGSTFNTQHSTPNT